jgi:hypothetical protein
MSLLGLIKLAQEQEQKQNKHYGKIVGGTALAGAGAGLGILGSGGILAAKLGKDLKMDDPEVLDQLENAMRRTRNAGLATMGAGTLLGGYGLYKNIQGRKAREASEKTASIIASGFSKDR